MSLRDLFEDEDGTDAPTCVGRLSSEDIAAMLREADAREARARRATESGIRPVEAVRACADALPIALPAPPRVPVALALELDDAEPTRVASVLPQRPAMDTADDEIARVLDFDWDACAPAEAPMPTVTSTPSPPPIPRRAPVVHVLLAFAVAAVLGFAISLPIALWLLATH